MAARKQHRRWWVWGPLLVVSLFLVLFADKTPDADGVVAPRVQSAVRAPAPPVPSVPAPQLAAGHGVLVPREQLVRLDARAPLRDLFQQRSWNPPAALPQTVVQPAPAPTAPPLPFVYLGKKQEGDAWEVYLGQGENTLVAREGQVLLQEQYRVQSIKPPHMELVYLPLGQAQSLTIGETR